MPPEAWEAAWGAFMQKIGELDAAANAAVDGAMSAEAFAAELEAIGVANRNAWLAYLDWARTPAEERPAAPSFAQAGVGKGLVDALLFGAERLEVPLLSRLGLPVGPRSAPVVLARLGWVGAAVLLVANAQS